MTVKPKIGMVVFHSVLNKFYRIEGWIRGDKRVAVREVSYFHYTSFGHPAYSCYKFKAAEKFMDIWFTTELEDCEIRTYKQIKEIEDGKTN